MLRALVGLSALLAAVFAPLGHASAEIDWDYVKPASERSVGSWLSDILGVSDFGQDYAVIVGLHRFEHFNPLDATEDDPDRVFEYLRDEAGFDYILMLRDDEVTYAKLRSLFEFELPRVLDADDRFLLFWSGHGTQFRNALGTELGYLPLIASPADDKSTMIAMHDLERWDRELPAKHALFLLDACFSGLAGTAVQSDERDLEISELAKPGHHIISAGGSDQQTIASRQAWQGSIFTHALLTALRGQADRYGGKNTGDGVINLHELVSDIGETVKNAKAAAGWTRPLRPRLHAFRGEGGQFFFLTEQKKRAHLQAQGKQVSDAMAHGMPVVVLGDEPTAARNSEKYGDRDAMIFDIIKDSQIANDFEAFLADYPESPFAPFARNRLALLREEATEPTAPPSISLIYPPLSEGSDVARVASSDEPHAIVGRVDAAAGIVALVVNGRVVPIEDKNLFRTEVPVAEEGTQVSIAAIDHQGRRTDLEFRIQPGSDRSPATTARTALLDFDLGDFYALVIGNSEYQHLPNLESPAKDAPAVAEVLSRKYGFEVTLLENATRYEILSVMNDLRARLTENANLLIYYAGHGELDRVNTRGHWLPIDAETHSSANWISNIQLADILNAMAAKRVLVVADTSYPAALADAAAVEPNFEINAGPLSDMSDEAKLAWIRAVAAKRSRLALTSGGLAPTLDDGPGEHSVFGAAFLDVLRENDGLMEGQRLFRELSPRVIYAATEFSFEQLPQYSPIKYAGHEAGEFFFVPNPA